MHSLGTIEKLNARETEKLKKTKLVRVVIERRSDGKWDCTRMRSAKGEAACGMGSLADVIDYLIAHPDFVESDK